MWGDDPEPPTLEPVEVRETVEGTAYRFANQEDRARFLTYNFPRLTPVSPIVVNPDVGVRSKYASTYKCWTTGHLITTYGKLNDCLMVWKG